MNSVQPGIFALKSASAAGSGTSVPVFPTTMSPPFLPGAHRATRPIAVDERTPGKGVPGLRVLKENGPSRGPFQEHPRACHVLAGCHIALRSALTGATAAGDEEAAAEQSGPEERQGAGLRDGADAGDVTVDAE